MSDNLKIWDAVSTTDPSHTKKVTFGRSFTAIDPHYQIKMATEQFGPVGEGWGYNCEHNTIQVDDVTLFAICDVWVWWESPKHLFGPLRGASELRYVTKDGKVKTDTDAPKKAMTDALTKGLSHLGFNADVFLGLFDDNKYVQKLIDIHAQTNMNGTKVDIQKLDAVVDLAIEIVDDPDNDLEVGAPKAREIYEPLDNDERMYVNGKLSDKKFRNPSTGRDVQYWSAFVKYLKAAGEK